MRLFNIIPVESAFAFNGPDAPPIYLKGVWVGGHGRDNGFITNFTPIIVGDEEPDSQAWGLTPSRTNRPKIVANANRAKGWIAMLSAYTGDGPIVGRVFVSYSHHENVLVLAHGVGGTHNPPVRYSDYLIKVFPPTNFLIQGTRQPPRILSFGESEVIQSTLSDEQLHTENFVSLDDSSIRRWKGKEKNGETHHNP